MKKEGTLAIRFALHGCVNRPFYHIVVIQKHKARNGRIISQIGTYDPMINQFGERLFAMSFQKYRKWILREAQPTKSLVKMLGIAGFYPIHPQSILHAHRKRMLQARQASEAKQQTEEFKETAL
ncbi:28S ribosomal protein S16, mitochondrial [Lingula anatina]|uniref:Small ribosomal subunit protein bS16m n=1 Tax=Lingula anatina TaxID=7574 RepID=A0A1S3J9N4_LINAN|nr:28S ribosomal protein S16, mitochondrial [Lingula anatina]|eukprot:XP_013407112.1 28S ribosomal protein S16, mitochondrial [Lingula anatina]